MRALDKQFRRQLNAQLVQSCTTEERLKQEIGVVGGPEVLLVLIIAVIARMPRVDPLLPRPRYPDFKSSSIALPSQR